MFSSQISSRDLFFSNPVERFLGNEAGLKTSFESGFSSTLGYSQSEQNKDLLSGNSEEIFSQTPKAINEPQAAKTDYQKYISQNLLFGKKGKPDKYSIRNKENELNGKNSTHSENKEQELQGINEIKGKIESLLDGIRRLNSDVSDVKDSVKGMEIEITRQNERISSFEEIFSQKTKMMEETEKYWKKCSKEDTTGKLQKLITENFKETKQAIDKLIDTTEKNQGKITENIRKNCTSQAIASKKTSEEIKKFNDFILRKLTAKIDKMQNAFEEKIEKLKNKCDENYVTKIEELKTLISNSHTSSKEIIASHKPNSFNPTLYKAPTMPSHQNLPQSIFQSAKSNISRASNRPLVPFHISGVKRENSEFGTAHSRTEGSVHTPLMEMMRRNKTYSAHTPLMEAMKRNKTPSISDCMQGTGNKIPRLSDLNHVERNTIPRLGDFNERQRHIATSMLNYMPENEKTSPSTTASEPSLMIVKEIRCPSYILRKSSKQYSRCTSFNFKKKSATPPKPSQQRNARNTNQFSSAFDSSFTKNNSKNTESKRNLKTKRNLRPKKGRINYKETDTLQSSPYLSIFEASMAQEYAFL